MTTPDARESIAGVLAEHRFQPTASVDGTMTGYGRCGCGKSYSTKRITEHEAHVADALLAAGYGHVPSALREAVDAMSALDEHQIHQEAYDWLRERADQIDNQGDA